MSADSAVPSSETPQRRWFTFGRVAAAGSLFGLTALTFVTGAATMYFGLPSSGYLALAFEGGRDVLTPRPDATVNGDLSGAQLTTHKEGAAYDGYTLYTTTQGAEATLLDMKGAVVRRWTMPRTASWPPVGAVPLDKPLHFERCYLYPNGDLLALCCSGGDVPYGCGVVKVDKDSKFVWGYKGNVHHDLDVGDDGRVYVLTQELPPAGRSGQEREIAVAERIVILSPDGREQAEISLQEAFAKSPYALLLQPPDEEGSDGPPRPNLPGFRPPSGAPQPPVRPRRPAPPEDVLHSNSVKVLSAALAPKFPLFKAGQLLISLRNPSVLAVVDPTTRGVVWAAKGPWQNQHDAEFLDNGRLLLFDNRGAGRSARVLEYDPQTQALPWSSGGQGGLVLSAIFRGTSQRLANGNTLVVDPARCRITELKADKEVVWEWGLPQMPNDATAGDNGLNMTGARRFGADELPFLKGK